jgi:hypothetical protein
MRQMLVWGVLVLALAAVALSVGPSGAQEKPDATITFSGGSVSAGIGYSWGSGTLTYQGKEYPFSVDGLSVGAVGATSVTASGEVYHLKKLEDFNGNYAAATASATLGGGAGGTAMENQAGVVIRLVSTTQGVDFKLAASGVKISLK